MEAGPEWPRTSGQQRSCLRWGGPALQGAAVSSDQPQGESSPNQDRAPPRPPAPGETGARPQASPRSEEKRARGRPPKIRQLWTLLRDPILPRLPLSLSYLTQVKLADVFNFMVNFPFLTCLCLQIKLRRTHSLRLPSRPIIDFRPQQLPPPRAWKCLSE